MKLILKSELISEFFKLVSELQNLLLIFRLPDNPPPPPPKQFVYQQPSQINNNNSEIYNEIEANNEQSTNKPQKLQQKISLEINKNLRRRSNERRRTTQFELFNEGKIVKKQNDDDGNYNDIENNASDLTVNFFLIF